jgi:transposase InsO family protein
MIFQFIEDHRDEFPVIRMCKVLEVSRSGYYAWRGRPPSEREMANQELYEKIKEEYDKSSGTYGSPRIYQALKKQGIVCSENRVARLMRSRDLRAKQKNRYRTTTRPNKADPVAPNLVDQDFEAERPNQKWLTDITYISTEEGWLYLAAVLDLCSRRIVGWAMSDRMTGDLTIRALKMAIRQRQPELDLIHHSDQGSQYTAGDYQQLLKDWDIRVSMNGAGSWYDNSPMESFFGTLKSERVYHQVYRTHDEARSDLFYYIEVFYNRRRLHSSLGYCSPEEYEQQYYAEQTFA